MLNSILVLRPDPPSAALGRFLFRYASSSPAKDGFPKCRAARLAAIGRLADNQCQFSQLRNTKPMSTSSRSFSSSLSPQSSVSSSEVKKFDSHDISWWWDARKNPLIPMNVTRVQYIAKHVREEQRKRGLVLREEHEHFPLNGLSVLDVGCGGGLLSESLARLGAKVTGIDPTKQLVRAAELHAKMVADERTVENLNYMPGMTAERLLEMVKSRNNVDPQNSEVDTPPSTPEPPSKFDIVCLLEVVEHASDVDSLISAASELVKSQDEGGILFVSTLNRTIKSYLLTIVGAEYIMGYVPKGTHDWNQYLSPEEIRDIASRTGNLEERDVSGVVLAKPPLFGQWEWKLDPSDTDVNWIATYQKVQPKESSSCSAGDNS